MNNLNQILLEGNVNKMICGIGTNLTIWVKTNNVEKESVFKIHVSGDLAKNCYEQLKPGRGIRIIGRLDRDGNNIYIVADHVIFKPESKMIKVAE